MLCSANHTEQVSGQKYLLLKNLSIAMPYFCFQEMESILSRVIHVHAYSAAEMLHQIDYAKELVEAEVYETLYLAQ